MTTLPVFMKRNFDMYTTVSRLNENKNCKMFLGLPQNPTTVFRANNICLPTPRLTVT